MQKFESIQNRIYTIREERVMLDYDLAVLYEVETRILNQAVKRNISRFPEDFMFKLSSAEWEELRAQVATGNNSHVDMRSQIVISSGATASHSSVVFSIDTSKKRAEKYLPFAFTEHGIAMLSGVLHSEKAIKMNIAIMRTFIAVKKLSVQQLDLLKQIKAMEDRLGNHDAQLSELYQAMENLIDENQAKKKWDNRPRIGFKP